MNSKIVFASIAAMLMIFGAVAVFDDSNADAAKDISKVEFDSDKDQYYLMTTLGTADLKGLSGTYMVNTMKENIIPNHFRDGVYVSEVKNVADLDKDKISIDIVDKEGNHYVYNTYSIIVSDKIENGSVTSDKAVAKAGEKVSLTVTPEGGYTYGNVAFNGNEIEASEGKYEFTMPAEDAVITAEFKAIPTYSVNIGSTENGTVTASKEKFVAENETVILTVVPEKGFMLGSLQIIGKEKITPTNMGDGKYSFAMPASNVTVAATFTNAPLCKVTFDNEVSAVLTDDAILKSGESVPAGTEVKVIVKEKLGYTCTVSPALDDDNTYTVTKDVEFKVTYTEKEYSDASFSGDINTSSEFTEKQLVTVPSDSTIMSGSVITINGKLYVPAGVTLTISAGAQLVINGIADIQGNLVVEEAEEDGKIAAGEFIVNGEATVSGNLDVRGLIKSAGTYFGYGAKITIASAAEIAGEIEGRFVIAEDASLTIAGNVAGDVMSSFASSDTSCTFFEVAGKLIVSSDEPMNGFAVKLTKNGSVDIEKVVLGTSSALLGQASGTIVIIDDGVYYNDKDDKKLVSEEGSNRAYIVGFIEVGAGEGADASRYEPFGYGAVVTGITVSVQSSTEKITTGAHKDEVKHTSVMSVSGNVSVSDSIIYDQTENSPVPVKTKIGDVEYTSPLAGIDARGADKTTLRIDEDLSIGENVYASFWNAVIAAPVSFHGELELEDVSVEGNITVPANGKLTVIGEVDVKATIDVSAKDAKLVVTDAEIDVSGDGSIIASKKLEGYTSLNATLYNTYSYVSFDSAVAALNSGAVKTKIVEVYGEQALTASAGIPAGSAVKLTKDSHLSIGSKDSTDVRLDIEASSSLAIRNSDSKGIEVYGTLNAEKMSNIDSSLRSGTMISSDVYSCAKKANGAVDTTGFAKWTNIYTAMEEATADSTVTLQRDVELVKELAVGEGITLDVNGKKLSVDHGVKLTVDGILDLTGSSLVIADEIKNAEGKVEKEAGVFVNNGYVYYTGADVPVDGPADLAGAYYTIAGKETKVLTTYAKGAADVLKAQDYKVELKGDSKGVIALGEISFAGEKDKVVIVTVASAEKITGTVSLSYAHFDVADADSINARFVSGDDSITVIGDALDLCIENGILGEETVLMIHGCLYDIVPATGSVDTSLVLDGNVYVSEDLDVGVDKVAVNGALVLTAGADVVIDTLEIPGSVAIKEGAELYSEALTVTGSISVEKGLLDADEAVVYGSVDAKAEGASAIFGILYIGVDATIVESVSASSATGADASVTGNVELTGYALAAPGATVPEAFTKEDSVYKSTVFKVEGAVYVTAYAVDGCTVLISQIAYQPENAEFNGWFVDLDADTSEAAGALGSEKEVSAKIDYEIYSIKITTDGGIAYITVGGKLMTGHGNEFTIEKLKAGSYDIVISPISGYDTSKVVLKNMDGTPVGSMSVSVSGTDKAYNYQLIGSAPVVPDTPEPTPIIIKDDKDSSLTDTLLIVLVVLIVIMAILVALRMMRS